MSFDSSKPVHGSGLDATKEVRLNILFLCEKLIIEAMPVLDTIWIVKTDYSGYFKNLIHDDLKFIARRKISCKLTLKLLDAIIDSTPGGVGIPVGNLTSQWLANLLGNEIDQYVKRTLKVKRYIRYTDDCVAIFGCKQDADKFLAEMTLVSSKFGLRFSKYSIHRASQGINMLGYRIWPSHKLLRKRSIKLFRRDLKHIELNIESGIIGIKSKVNRIKSFVAHANHADTWRLRTILFNET